jgi:hypothetical protein
VQVEQHQITGRPRDDRSARIDEQSRESVIGQFIRDGRPRLDRRHPESPHEIGPPLLRLSASQPDIPVAARSF